MNSLSGSRRSFCVSGLLSGLHRGFPDSWLWGITVCHLSGVLNARICLYPPPPVWLYLLMESINTPEYSITYPRNRWSIDFFAGLAGSKPCAIKKRKNIKTNNCHFSAVASAPHVKVQTLPCLPKSEGTLKETFLIPGCSVCRGSWLHQGEHQ